MRRILAIAAVFASLSAPCLADTVSPDVWESYVQNVSSAAACGLISDTQAQWAVNAGINYMFAQPGYHMDSTVFQGALVQGLEAGRKEADVPGFCDNFPPALMNSILGAVQQGFSTSPN